MDWFPFHHPTDNFWPFVRWREKNFGRAEGPLYNQRIHFPVLSEKFFRSKERGLRFCSKMSFHYSTDRMNRSVTILSHRRFPIYFTMDIFPKKLGTLFQKTFLASDPPSTQLRESEIGFVPDFSKKFRKRRNKPCALLQIALSLSNGHDDAECHGSVITRAKKKRLPLRQALLFCINYSSKSSISL